MEHNPLTNEELERLTHYAGQKLGLTPEQMATAVNEGGLAALSQKLSERDTQRLSALLRDPEKAKQLMAMPEVQQLIRSLLNKG